VESRGVPAIGRGQNPQAMSQAAFLDPQPDALVDPRVAVVDVRAPRHYQDRALAAFEDARLLLGAILPEACIEHVGASAIPGAYSKGGVDICVAVPRDRFLEALGVLGEAGYAIRPGALRTEQLCSLDAPAGDVPLTVRLIEAGSRHESFIGFRDALRDDAVLVARYNALRLEAAPFGAAAYREAKQRFILDVLRH
jgi:GrpB-like predicted nucleotidyltransferase (UPF0157 family)